ncbi:hypothetical protein [Paraburkholderia sp. D1E]|uniref:hypothetical protein n=1 Tax=Paraburkholderia sp. D1E TaxID=3461398 RepID=UPI004045EBFE
MSEADDAAVLATLARLRRVREMRSQLARVAAARQQGIAAQSRRALDDAQQRLNQQVALKAAIQQRLVDGAAGHIPAGSARALQEAAADTRTANLQIGTATQSVEQADTTHDGHEAELAQLQRAARRAKAAEDKLEKAGEKAQRALAARVERAAEEVADSHAIRGFSSAARFASAADHATAARAAEPAAEEDVPPQSDAPPFPHANNRC